MSIIAPGTPAPEFTLKTEDGDPFTREDFAGKTTVLVFYPFAFSSVCTDQFHVYQEVLWDFTEQGATLYGVSTDAPDSQRAFRESLGVDIHMLSDFEPKGATAKRSARTSSRAAWHPRPRDRRARAGRQVVMDRRAPRHPAGREPDLRRPGGRLTSRARGAAARLTKWTNPPILMACPTR